MIYTRRKYILEQITMREYINTVYTYNINICEIEVIDRCISHAYGIFSFYFQQYIYLKNYTLLYNAYMYNRFMMDNIVDKEIVLLI